MNEVIDIATGKPPVLNTVVQDMYESNRITFFLDKENNCIGYKFGWPEPELGIGLHETSKTIADEFER